MRAIIFLLASTAMRVGAIPSLRLRNLEKIESEYDIYKITVYKVIVNNTLLFAHLNVPEQLTNI